MPVLSKNLSVRGIEESPEIQYWLSQFSARKRPAAISLLMHLRFVSRDAYSDWLLSALQPFSAEGPCGVYSVRKLANGQDQLWDDAGCVVGRPGFSQGSEDLVYSLIASAARSSHNLLDHPDLQVLRTSRAHNILLIDDSIGSGQRVSEFIRAMMAHKTFRSWWSFGFICLHILSLARTRESEKAILKATPGSDHGRRACPKASKVRFASDIVYSREWLQGRWGDGYQAILDLCDSQPAVPEWCRQGFGGVMASIVFYHSVPDNIPGAIWYENSTWTPLFPGRAVPEWLTETLARFSAADKGSASGSRVVRLSPEMISLLHLIKNGVRHAASLALRMDADISLVGPLIRDAQASGFVTPTNRITTSGVTALRRARNSGPSLDTDRSLYIPMSWCVGRATVQPSTLETEQTDPAEASALTGGEAGQASLERTDARTAAPSSNVRPHSPSTPRKGPDVSGPLGSKER